MGKTSGSVKIGQPGGPNEGAPRRCFINGGKTLVDGVSAEIPTVYDVFTRSARLFPNQNAIGERPLIRMHNEEKEVTKTVKGKEVKETKKWQYYEKVRHNLSCVRASTANGLMLLYGLHRATTSTSPTRKPSTQSTSSAPVSRQSGSTAAISSTSTPLHAQTGSS